MIRIYKDRDIKTVTQGAYETFYKPLGYNIIIEETQKKPAQKQETFTRYNNQNAKPRKVSLNKKNKEEE